MKKPGFYYFHHLHEGKTKCHRDRAVIWTVFNTVSSLSCEYFRHLRGRSTWHQAVGDRGGGEIGRRYLDGCGRGWMEAGGEGGRLMEPAANAYTYTRFWKRGKRGGATSGGKVLPKTNRTDSKSLPHLSPSANLLKGTETRRGFLFLFVK